MFDTIVCSVDRYRAVERYHFSLLHMSNTLQSQVFTPLPKNAFKNFGNRYAWNKQFFNIFYWPRE